MCLRLTIPKLPTNLGCHHRRKRRVRSPIRAPNLVRLSPPLEQETAVLAGDALDCSQADKIEIRDCPKALIPVSRSDSNS